MTKLKHKFQQITKQEFTIGFDQGAIRLGTPYCSYFTERLVIADSSEPQEVQSVQSSPSRGFPFQAVLRVDRHRGICASKCFAFSIAGRQLVLIA